MNNRERFVAWMLGQKVDRPPFWLRWGGWASTWRRWRAEGMPESIRGMGEIAAMFGADATTATVPVNYGPCPCQPDRVLREDDDYIVFVDNWGITRRNPKHNESMSEFISFPVKSRADWERFRDERLNPDDPRRLEGDWLERARQWMARGQPIQLGDYPDVGTFGSVRWLLGDEDGLVAYLDQPELVQEIMDHCTSLYLTVFEKVVRAGVRVDVVHIWEDMCGRQGPLISPAMVRQFMAPCYRRIKAFCREHDIPLMSVDTDGKPHLIVPPMMEAGVNYIWPWEVAAGCDVNQVRRQFPELALMGGIDKRALAVGPAAIDAELDRIRPAVAAGRYVPELDHGVPDNVSWENYCHYAGRLRRLVYDTPVRHS